MEGGGRRLAMLAVSALVVASCASAGGKGGAATPTPWPTQQSAESAPTPTPARTQRASQLPSAPANVGTDSSQPWGVECRSEEDGGCCWVDLRWQNTAGSGARFRIYQAWTGEEVSGTPVCSSVKGEAKMPYETPEGWASIYLEVGDMVIGNGAPCYWVSAVNDAGESKLVPSSANWEGD